MTFENKRHIEIDEGFQGINLTEFSVAADEGVISEEIVDAFIKTEQFAFESLRECIKKEPNKGYLRRAFDFEKIKVADFKKYSKKETEKFLMDFLNETDWGDDRTDFVKLLDRYLEIHNQFNNNDFFIISKAWFKKEDERLMEPEKWIYTYCFFIISVDRASSLLTMTEWTYD